MSYLIVSLTSLLFGFAAAGYLFRRYHMKYVSRYQEQESQLEKRKEAIQEIMYRTHHHGVNPISKRIRGLCNLALLASARLLNYLDLLSRPHHHEYGRLATGEIREILQYIRIIEREAHDLEEETLNNVKEFEHLQE